MGIGGIVSEYPAHNQQILPSAKFMSTVTQNGLGQPFVDVPPKQLANFFKVRQYNPECDSGESDFLMQIAFTETYCCVATVSLTKASILAMYWRVLPSVWIRRNVYICGTLLLLWSIGTTITNSLCCIPVQRIWYYKMKGTCISWSGFYLGMQIPNIFTDVYIVVVPLREVFALRLTRPQKAILVGIFGIATL